MWAPQSSPEGMRRLSTLDWSCPRWVASFPCADGHSEGKMSSDRYTVSLSLVDPVPVHLAGRGRGAAEADTDTGSLWGADASGPQRGGCLGEKVSRPPIRGSGSNGGGQAGGALAVRRACAPVSRALGEAGGHWDSEPPPCPAWCTAWTHPQVTGI